METDKDDQKVQLAQEIIRCKVSFFGSLLVIVHRKAFAGFPKISGLNDNIRYDIDRCLQEIDDAVNNTCCCTRENYLQQTIPELASTLLRCGVHTGRADPCRTDDLNPQCILFKGA